MNSDTLNQDVDRVCDLIDNNTVKAVRSIIGIAGPPASGKSTLSEAVVDKINQEDKSPIPAATLLPMDGFHLDNTILKSRGLLSRKGAPETFNAYGFCEAVEKISSANHELYLPRFDRSLELAIANAITIHPETRIVIVEGNYLLLQSQPWLSLQNFFTATVFLSLSMETLEQRLIDRWLSYGLDHEAARKKATGNDLVNADLIMSQSRAADLVLSENYA